MIIYVESSAVLAWLLGESTESVVLDALRNADRVVTSSLTALECARGINRAMIDGRITAVQQLAALRLLDDAQSAWHVHAMNDRVVARARAQYPAEPVRTLDALHLATALVIQESVGPLTLLTFDDRVRVNANALGFGLLPAALSR